MMISAVILGSISGKLLFSKYKDDSFNDGKNLYFLQEGVYDSKESLESNTKDIKGKLVIPNKDKYYVYVGITGTNDNVEKIKKVYTKKGYSIYKKQIKVDNLEFINNIEQFDILLDNASNNDILTIEEVVLSNYEDLHS